MRREREASGSKEGRNDADGDAFDCLAAASEVVSAPPK